MQDVTRTNWWKRMVLRTIAVTLIGLVILGPLAGTLVWSFAEKWYWPNVFPQEIGLKYWKTSLSGQSQVMESLWVSLVTAVIVVAWQCSSRFLQVMPLPGTMYLGRNFF
jgi:putative spermidine/putrescine transport system permease protein